MGKLKQFEFFVLRYSPNAVRNERINIGFVVLEHGSNGSGFAEVSFTKDWRRAQCFDPEIDLEWLQALQSDIRAQLQRSPDRQAFMRKLEESFSNLIRLSPARALLTEDIGKELKKLQALYLAPPRVAIVKHEAFGRRKILSTMEGSLREAGILDLLLRDFEISRFTRPGDPLKLDFGYALGHEIKFLQAVSLKRSVDQGLMLASRFPGIAKAILDRDNSAARLMAVVDDDFEKERADIGFVLGMMQESKIQITMAGEMPHIAQEIRRELRA
jgi:hypothetical protein